MDWSDGTTVALRVLIVENDSDNAHSISLLLDHWGYEVKICLTRQEALKAGVAFCPDIVLLATRQPISGYELARQLREQGLAASAVLIGLSDTTEHQDCSDEAGIVLHLSKPMVAHELRSVFAALESRGT